MRYLGLIYAWTGEKHLAIEQIAATLQVPSLLSYGELRLHPFWDPLHGDPRFEKLVEEAKKPIALKLRWYASRGVLRTSRHGQSHRVDGDSHLHHSRRQSPRRRRYD
jgi:hypothetical protein